MITHSTYIEGLIPWLKQLSRQERIQTITPGVISRVRGHSPLLRLRISIQTCAGFKLVATIFQEVDFHTFWTTVAHEKVHVGCPSRRTENTTRFC